jgi:formylglycine-generating enzyme required for sulfatase activity
MKKKEFLLYTAFCLIFLLPMATDVSAGWEDMEVLNYYFGIDTTPRHQSRAEPEYNPNNNEFIGFWSTQGILRDDCEEDDDDECNNNFESVDGRRISPDGESIGNLIQLFPSDDEIVMDGPDFAHNMFTNEYLTATPIVMPSAQYKLYITIIDDVGNVKYGPEPIYESGDTTVMLPEVFFNAKRREYLVLYNDRIFNSYLNNVGFILDENANKKKGPFEVGNQVGDFFAQRLAYNPTDDTYLVVWEDFRNVAGDWTAKCDIYGALLNAETGGLIAEIPVMDDFGEEDNGDQRVPVPVYNPDKNEFLVVYKDIKDSLNDAAILGRFINADGTLKGPEFVIVDAPRIQHWPDIKYVEEEQKYFMVWNDLRNDGLPKGTPFYLSEDIDVYGSWLDDMGKPIGEEIVIADAIDWQFTPHMVYNPVMKRFLIGWHDRNEVDDYDFETGPLVPFAPAPSDVRGTIYGAPSFLSGRVVEEGTESPVEDAWVLVIGPSFPALKITNVGGWWNIEENSQAEGIYLVVVFKLGYYPAIKSVVYAGEPRQVTIKATRFGFQATTTTTSIITTTTTSIPVDQTTTTTADITTTTTIMCIPSDITLTMVDIPGGTFEMGCSPGDGDCLARELPSHTVTISAFKMSAYEITQDQWEAIMCDDPSFFQGCSNCPVDEVSWDQIQVYIERLNELTGESYRLPTEAEWEYAARAGTTTKYSCGDAASCLDDIAWYNANSEAKTQPVGQKQPNAWGLYDMTGNLWEYCQDFYDDDYYEESPDTDPPGPDSGFYRVIRGGGWNDDAGLCRISYRAFDFVDTGNFNVGFRLVQD